MLLRDLNRREARGEKISFESLAPTVLDYDQDALARLREPIERAQVQALEEVEQRFGHLYPADTAFSVWLMTSAAAAERRAKRVQHFTTLLTAAYFDDTKPVTQDGPPLSEYVIELEALRAEAARRRAGAEHEETLRSYRALLDELVADTHELWVGVRERDGTRYYAAILACERSAERLKSFRTAYTQAIATGDTQTPDTR
jgi:hypothetical protein